MPPSLTNHMQSNIHTNIAEVHFPSPSAVQTLAPYNIMETQKASFEQ